jgi:hypothetical protein
VERKRLALLLHAGTHFLECSGRAGGIDEGILLFIGNQQASGMCVDGGSGIFAVHVVSHRGVRTRPEYLKPLV